MHDNNMEHTESSPLLSIHDLQLSIHGSDILHHVSLSIEQGQVLGVIGESGSGKSMTALSIMQLLPEGATFSGEIVFDQQSLLTLNDESMCRLRGNDIGMVFQEPMTALNPVHSIGEQVSECLRVHRQLGRRAARQEAAKVLERVGLPNDEFPLSRYPHELSGGQRQRVVIAMAVAMKPKLLIADEPTTALDVTTQAEILELLKSLAISDNMAMMLITHDLAVVANIADHIVIMRDGLVVDHGPTKRLFDELAHPYTQALFTASSHVPVRKKQPVTTQNVVEVEQLICEYPMPRRSVFGKRPVFRAVDQVSFSIATGESVGLVGESGCGKSTLSRALLGLAASHGGSIVLRGEAILAGREVSRQVRREMQVVFQDPYSSFNPRHRVGRLIAEPLFVLDAAPSHSERQRRVNESLLSVGLEVSDASKYIHEFSGGQRQRIAIARALIIRPALIVLDEAVSALDVSVRAQTLDLLAELANEYGLAYLFISHDLSVVRNVTDRVLVMQKGKIVEQGMTADVFQSPQHPYTQALLSAVPILPQVSNQSVTGSAAD